MDGKDIGMTDQIRESYFLAVRIILLLMLEVYSVLSQYAVVGASPKMLLLLASFAGLLACKETLNKKLVPVFLVLMGVVWALMLLILGRTYVLIGILLAYELLSYLSSIIKVNVLCYLFPCCITFASSVIDPYIQVLMTGFLAIIYFQHDYVIASYREQAKVDTLQEQHLKHDIFQKENEMEERINQSLLQAQNEQLEERAKLSQTLHDKLGHNINGSIYQLEAIKVLMEKDPEKSKGMVQAVIDQLRTGMDEIRAILRKERPEKYRFAILQLQKLCDECNAKGVDARLVTEGELNAVPEKYLEIILDNAYEAVSNSMKYAKCTNIDIKIHVLNKLVRCSISDNGVGCEEVVDGMGIGGMRKRMREINGILDFDTSSGFSINMLMPM